ncbi:WW DOMAIN BINDING PROTEIN 2 ISOFORM E [Salix viminalis]|uniref:WW DOMAIN BINDING PROTEIN 2 ISOFORM E n=1 Tax=Salix viminalis TaxID=40686 RepID=A0A9Q0YXK5_SALVM|nr:WW DOMAIN BINDING PROTEIN 2 ISOFORM E [Salix viminalis]
MALNPQLFQNGMPVPFVSELFVLARDGVDFEVDKIPGPSDHVFVLMFYLKLNSVCLNADAENLKAKGTIYLSNIRMVFVAAKPVANFYAFDMPLLFVNGEKFNQPIFLCNNISGFVEPVVPENENRALYSTHSFKILFKEGGCGTFVPAFSQFDLFVNTPVDEMMRHAYVDPNDPTRIFLQQPTPQSELRRRTYQPSSAERTM